MTEKEEGKKKNFVYKGITGAVKLQANCETALLRHDVRYMHFSRENKK